MRLGWSTRIAPSPGRSSRASRAFTPAARTLEDRVLLTIQGLTLTAVPQKLPANGKWIPIHLTGQVTSSRHNEVPTVTLQVIDQYAYAQGTRAVKLTKLQPGDFKFDMTIRLLARHSSTFTSGRLYSVSIGAQDSDNGAGKTVPVLVPNPKG